MKNLFAPRKWFDLVPDQSHTVVTAGYHSLAGNIGKWWRYSSHIPVGHIKELLGGSIDTNTYATAARTSDGSLAIAYLPTIRTITVDMSKLAGPTTARWFDPTDGSYADLSDLPFANSGSRELTPPGNNAQGDGDWVLLLELCPRADMFVDHPHHRSGRAATRNSQTPFFDSASGAVREPTSR